jgi:protein-tyrosine-phosphatase
MKVSIVCHGNIARSQILHHYLRDFADKALLSVDLFSCGTAPLNAYPDTDRLLADVKAELRRRGLKGTVRRNVFDNDTKQLLANSDLILVADRKRRQEILSRLGDQIPAQKVRLFYGFIGEGQKDFIDTYDAARGAQDPERFASCFDELERIAKLTISRIQAIA